MFWTLWLKLGGHELNAKLRWPKLDANVHQEILRSTADIYYSRLLLNQNKSGKLNTSKTYLKEPIFSTTDIY